MFTVIVASAVQPKSATPLQRNIFAGFPLKTRLLYQETVPKVALIDR